MPDPSPELLFLSGPQEGQRAVLFQPVALAGRAEDCEVHLVEEFASRQHLRFQRTNEGCQVEVLSSRGARINGKLYKPPTKVLLDTGDLISLATETVILFVAAGDDPEAALAEYRKAHPAPAPVQRPPPVPAGLAATRRGAGQCPVPPPPPEPPPPAEEQAPKPSPPVTPAAQEEARRRHAQATSRAKLRKYAVLGGVYAIFLVGLAIFLATRSRGPASVATGGPPGLLPESAIEDAVQQPLSRATNENLAAENLHQAQTLYDSRGFHLGNRQKCVKGFKLCLAFLNRKEFDSPADSDRCHTVSGELIDQVRDAYREAWLREKARLWAKANQKWEEVRAMLPPDSDWNSPAYKAATDNVMAHIAYTRMNMPRGGR